MLDIPPNEFDNDEPLSMGVSVEQDLLYGRCLPGLTKERAVHHYKKTLVVVVKTNAEKKRISIPNLVPGCLLLVVHMGFILVSIFIFIL